MECLKICNVKIVIRVDLCGGIYKDGKELSIGDNLIPKLAYSGDGTCPQYLVRNYDELNQINSIINPIPKILELKSGNQNVYITKPDDFLKELLFKESLSLIPNRVKEVDFWTTDALFCETDEFIDALKSIDVQGLDMENSVLFLLGRLYNIKVGAILTVSDLPGHPKYDLLKSKTINPNLGTGIDNMIKIIINILPKINSV